MANTQCHCRRYAMHDRDAIREAVFDDKGNCNSADFHTATRCFNLPHEHVHAAVQAAYYKLGDHPHAKALQGLPGLSPSTETLQ